MSIDTRGRTAADGLRTAGPPIDSGTMLRAMHDVRRRRNRRAILAGTLAAVVVAAVVLVAVRPAGHTAEPGRPPTTGTGCPTPFVGHQPLALGESLAGVTCLGGRSFRRDMAVPVAFTLPPTFTIVIENGQDRHWVWFARMQDGERDMDNGVTVMEQAVPVRPTTAAGNDIAVDGVRDPTAGTTPESVAQWLSKRPRVTRATVTATTLAGIPAYRVDLAQGEGLVPVFAQGSPSGVRFGIAAGTYVRCWLFELPGSGLSLVWSQTHRDVADLAVNEAVVDTLRFDG